MKNISEFLTDWGGFRSKLEAHFAKVEDILASRTANDELADKNAQLIADLATSKASIADLQATVESQELGISDYQSQLAAAKDALTASEAEKQLLINEPNALASRKAGAIVEQTGTAVLPVAQVGGEGKETMTRADFDKLSPKARMTFVAGGGRLTDSINPNNLN